ncbi:MAG: hypothetical protein ABL891_19280 [Burkholderiales bacterium]
MLVKAKINLIGFFILAFSSSIVTAQEKDKARLEQCGEISHRIACHATNACKRPESNATFEKRAQVELMILRLCKDGPKDFSEYWWIDVNGAYSPYYEDKNGKKSKVPPK